MNSCTQYRLCRQRDQGSRSISGIRAKLKRLDPNFCQIVDTYARMTERAEPRSLPAERIPAGTSVGMTLHHVSSNVLSGLIESLAGPL